MQFSIQREVLLKPLQQVVGVVERRQTLPVLANLLVQASGERVSFTGTDLEVEMIASTPATGVQEGEVTIPARKLFDIVRALPDGAKIDVKLNGERVALNAGRSRFTLATLPSTEFPVIDEIELDFKHAFTIGNRRRRQTAGADVQRDFPPVIYMRGKGESNLAHDLRPHVQRCICVRPGGQRQGRPGVRRIQHSLGNGHVFPP